jgi:hypothetical protein
MPKSVYRFIFVWLHMIESCVSSREDAASHELKSTKKIQLDKGAAPPDQVAQLPARNSHRPSSLLTEIITSSLPKISAKKDSSGANSAVHQGAKRAQHRAISPPPSSTISNVTSKHRAPPLFTAKKLSAPRASIINSAADTNSSAHAAPSSLMPAIKAAASAEGARRWWAEVVPVALAASPPTPGAATLVFIHIPKVRTHRHLHRTAGLGVAVPSSRTPQIRNRLTCVSRAALFILVMFDGESFI